VEPARREDLAREGGEGKASRRRARARAGEEQGGRAEEQRGLEEEGVVAELIMSTELPISPNAGTPPHARQVPPTPQADGAERAAADVVPGSAAGDVVPGSAAAFADVSLEQAKLALRKVKDPDLNLNIVDLGLVYDVRVADNNVDVDMSLTSPGCPSGPEIMSDVERVLKALPGVGTVTVNLVWSPFWTPDRIEPRVRAYMGL
jgi:metal-sulfur cluster biosynthetic enzyme